MANISGTISVEVYPKEIARLLRDELLSAASLARKYRSDPHTVPHAVARLGDQIKRCNKLYEALEASLK